MNTNSIQARNLNTNILEQNTSLTKTNEKTTQAFIAIACLSFFPLMYFIGKLAMQYFAG